jgi:hypothetical protein
MRVQCNLCANPIPTGIPLPGRTAHRTAGISLGSAGPRLNIKGNARARELDPRAQSFIESITIRLIKKSGENVIFYDSDIPSLFILHFKKKSSMQ